MKIWLVFVSIILLGSCTDNKENNDIKDLNILDLSVLTETQIESIGMIHNESIIRNFESINWSIGTEASLFERQINYVFQEDVKNRTDLLISPLELSAYSEMSILSSIDEFSNALSNSDGFKLEFMKLRDLVYASNKSYSDFENAFDEYYAKLGNALKGNDLVIMKLAANVLKSSYLLWSDVEFGGLGYTDKIRNLISDRKNLSIECGDTAAFADASAATIYILGTISACLFNPPACGAIAVISTGTGYPLAGWLVGWGISSGGASLFAYLNCIFG